MERWRIITLLLQRLIHGQHDPVDLRVLVDNEIKFPGPHSQMGARI